MYSTGLVDSCNHTFVCTGINNVASSDRVKLFPNPAHDFVKITVEGYSNYTLDLFDLNGRLLKSCNAFDSNLKPDLSTVDQGVYVIRLQSDNQIIGYKKLIKE